MASVCLMTKYLIQRLKMIILEQKKIVTVNFELHIYGLISIEDPLMRILDCWPFYSIKCSLQINECKLHVENVRDIVRYIKKTILSTVRKIRRIIHCAGNFWKYVFNSVA